MKEIIALIPARSGSKGVPNKNIRIFEVGIKYFGRNYSEGKKINWKDGISAIRCIFQYNLFTK